MVLACHVILQNHAIKALKSAIDIFSKAHGMSYSHIRNFTINVALTKIFACVSSDNSLILVTPSCIANDEIYAKNLLQVRPKTTTGCKKRKKKKAITKRFALHANAKRSCRNKQYSPYFVKVPRKFISWTSRKNKMPNYRFFFFDTNYSGDSHGVTFTTSNISLHLTVTCSRLISVLKI